MPPCLTAARVEDGRAAPLRAMRELCVCDGFGVSSPVVCPDVAGCGGPDFAGAAAWRAEPGDGRRAAEL
jgi:hypothetical protein